MPTLLEKLSQIYSQGEQVRRPATPREIARATGREPMELIDGVDQYPLTEEAWQEKIDGYSPRGGKR